MEVTSTSGQSHNLIAELPSGPDGAGIVIVGAHYDTVHFTQGANDNGSGVTALMAIAANIIDNDYPFTVRLLLFGAEEVGLVGSRYYVDQLTNMEREEIIAMINFDALGSGTTLESLGDRELTAAAVAFAQEREITYSGTLQWAPFISDQISFEEIGVVTIAVTADDRSRANSPQDTIEFVDPQLIAWGADIGIGLLDHLAQTRRN